MFAVLGSPHGAQDFPVGDGFVGMDGKIVQDFKFFGSEPHVFSFDGYAPVPKVNIYCFQGKLLGG